MVIGVLCCLLGSNVAMSAASDSVSPDTIRTPDGFDLQGHRGARGLAPENTIPAFRQALEIGVTTLEMDVVLSKEGAVVVSHEPWMAREKCRSPDGDRIAEGQEKRHNLYEMSYDSIAAYDCGRALSEFPDQESMSAVKPRLRDVIQMAEAYAREHDRPPVFYNIEIKSRPDWEGTFHPEPSAYASQVWTAVVDEGVASRTTLQSFDPRILEAAHDAQAPVRLALLVAGGGDEFSEEIGALSFVPDVYSPAVSRVDKALVQAVHEQGLQLIPWTVNDPTRMKEAIQLGVDGLITDYPDRGRSVLRALGL